MTEKLPAILKKFMETEVPKPLAKRMRTLGFEPDEKRYGDILEMVYVMAKHPKHHIVPGDSYTEKERALFDDFKKLYEKILKISGSVETEHTPEQQAAFIRRASALFNLASNLFGGPYMQTSLFREEEFPESDAQKYLVNALSYGLAQASKQIELAAGKAPEAYQLKTTPLKKAWARRENSHYGNHNFTDETRRHFYIMAFSPQINLHNKELQKHVVETLDACFSDGIVPHWPVFGIKREESGNFTLSFRLLEREQYVEIPLNYQHYEARENQRGR